MITATIVGRLIRVTNESTQNGTEYASLAVESRKLVGDKVWKKVVQVKVFGKARDTVLSIPIGSIVACSGDCEAFHTHSDKTGKDYANLSITGNAVWIKENQPE